MQQKVKLNRSPKISSARRGQIFALYALMVPIILLFTGLAFDLGWYYLNVSRLQNAADAAALAGARKIIDTNSTKLKDLVPVLVAKLPADNGLDDDGEPRVETSTSTETTTDTTETEAGTTITTTETTTTTTTTISKTQLKDLDWTDGDTTAKNYTVKNLGTTQNVQTDTDETASLIIDNWSLFNSASKRQVVPDLNLVKVNGDFYYIVKLDENIRHFFLSGWFDSMDAKVVAIAKLVPKDQVIVETNTTVKTWDEFIAKIRDIINRNVIVGNWEVQNAYKNSGGGLVNVAKVNITDPITGEAVKFYDENGNERTQVTAYEASFGTTVYSGAWNHFQDFKNHYYRGDFYRKETVIVKDDVEFTSDPNGEDIIDRNGNRGTITSYGKGKYGESSSVSATSAAINTNKKDLAVYNPEKKGRRKTYQDGITETGDVGLPYTWKRLDSINIDFRVEDTLSGKWLSEDWDWDLALAGDTTADYPNVTTSNTDFDEKGAYTKDDNIKRLRIHTSIKFEDPYKVRPDVDKPDEPDVLWARIESEPMLYHPDIMDRAYGKLTSKKNQTGLNSVNQIILNFNQSNYDTSAQRYRPLIIFYDGPETYSIYSYYDTVNKFVRKSQPVIVNLNAPYRVILYAPNSPVAVIGTDEVKNKFRGFIVAKSYVTLKTEDDFDFYRTRYHLKGKRSEELTPVEENGKTVYKQSNGTKVAADKVCSEDIYRSTDTNDTKDYYFVPADKNENGIEMFVDFGGNIQYKEWNNRPTKIGEYDNFGRTDFTTHNYHVESFLNHNLLLSGK